MCFDTDWLPMGRLSDGKEPLLIFPNRSDPGVGIGLSCLGTAAKIKPSVFLADSVDLNRSLHPRRPARGTECRALSPGTMMLASVQSSGKQMEVRNAWSGEESPRRKHHE